MTAWLLIFTLNYAHPAATPRIIEGIASEKACHQLFADLQALPHGTPGNLKSYKSDMGLYPDTHICLSYEMAR